MNEDPGADPVPAYGQRPPLPKLKPGDPVTVIEFFGRNGYRRGATVVRVARVWAELQEVVPDANHARAWRLRVDTQDDGARCNPRARFVTAAQLAWDDRLHAADETLRRHGVDVGYGTGHPWCAPERRMLLADILEQHLPAPGI